MNKTKPVSIRFDEEKLNFLLQKEGLKTKQRVVDFLLEKYWWESRVGQNPVLERNSPSAIPHKEKKTEPQNTPLPSKQPEKQKEILPLPAEIQAKIAEIEREIACPPAKFTSDWAKKSYFFDRKKQIEELKKTPQ